MLHFYHEELQATCLVLICFYAVCRDYVLSGVHCYKGLLYISHHFMLFPSLYFMFVWLELSTLWCCSPRLFPSTLRHGVWSWPRLDHPGRAPPVFTLASLHGTATTSATLHHALPLSFTLVHLRLAYLTSLETSLLYRTRYFAFVSPETRSLSDSSVSRDSPPPRGLGLTSVCSYVSLRYYLLCL